MKSILLDLIHALRAKLNRRRYLGLSGSTVPKWSKIDFSVIFWGPKFQGCVPMCANTFRRAPHPKWVPMGPNFVTKKF